MSTSDPNESFGEQKLLDSFLHGTKFMQIIEEKTEQFIRKYDSTKKPEDSRAAIILQLPFQFKDFAARSPTLLELIVEEPLEFLDTAKYLIYSKVSSILKQSPNFTPKSIDSAQIHIHCRFIGLPVQDDLLFNLSANQYRGGLSVITGVLSGKTEQESYTIQSIWYCTTGCQANHIKQEITKAPNCYTCSQPMSEYTKLRCMGKYRLLKIFPTESVSTPRVFTKIFSCQVIRLYDYTYDCDLVLGANYIVTGHLDFKTLEFIAWNLMRHPMRNETDNEDFSEFQHHQPMDIPLQTTELFREDQDESAFNEKTRKYPEFALSFSPGSVDSSLHLHTQQTDRVDLVDDSTQTKHEDSIYVHPQIKDEPLDLSFQSSFSSAKLSKAALECTTSNDFDLEFSAIAASVTATTSKVEPNDSFQQDAEPSQSAPSCSRGSPMEFLALSYSQASLDKGDDDANTRTDLHSSQSVQQIDTTQIPNSVQRLHETIKKAYSDFAFVYSLGAQMCQDRVPMDCFVHFKIGLLLSIASLEENPDRPPISIVGIGPEFGMANYMMETIGDVADRFVGPCDDFKVPANKSDKHTWIEADPIVMARGGIYYVGDWSRLKAARAFKIMKAIECGRVMLDQTTESYPLETAIWTHWRSYKYDTKDQHTFNKFLEIFGIPLIVEEDNHEVLASLILEQASVQAFESTIDEFSIGADDMREFLKIVSKRRVDIEHEASEILRKYFVASRMDRPDCLAQQSFSTLVLFAESFAKLSLRHEVITVDAVGAVYMTENFIQNIFGEGAYPPPKFKSHTSIGAVDEHMVEFQEWLDQYIAQFHDVD